MRLTRKTASSAAVDQGSEIVADSQSRSSRKAVIVLPRGSSGLKTSPVSGRASFPRHTQETEEATEKPVTFRAREIYVPAAIRRKDSKESVSGNTDFR